MRMHLPPSVIWADSEVADRLLYLPKAAEGEFNRRWAYEIIADHNKIVPLGGMDMPGSSAAQRQRNQFPSFLSTHFNHLG